ncbi:MAG: PKD domain-containing protein, partial [Halioglobus sp.]|nr:PKD domain-containing protein [Halioglobus sp.]
PIICFNAPDTFTVTLTATNVCGTSIWTGGIRISLEPMISLDTFPDSCGNAVVINNFGLTTEDYGSPITAYNWTFTGMPATFSGQFPPPVTFGPGNHTVSVGVTNDCGTTMTSTSFVIDSPTPVFGGNDTIICVKDSLTLTGDPTPGFWKGPGVDSAGNFWSAMLGTFELIYTYQASLCRVYDTVLVTVVDTPMVTAMADTSLCEGNAVVTLTANPPGGFWTGPGLINGNQFLADTPGNFIFTYEYPDPVSGCSGRDHVVVTVHPLPLVNAGSDTLYCLVPDPQQLPIAAPPGGFWTGTGVSNGATGEYTPTLLGAGTDTVIYCFTSAFGCERCDTLLVTVVVGDSAMAGPGDVLCQNAGVTALTGYSPLGGQWSGTGIVLGTDTFDPLLMASGNNQVIYTVAPATSCESSDTTFVTIRDTLAVSVGPDTVICETDPPFTLSGFSPLGGTWSGTGIVNPATGLYDPALVPTGATDTLIYEVVHPVTGCTSRDVRLIFKDSLPDIDFIPIPNGCIGDLLTFTNTSVNGVSFTWKYGDGSTPTASNSHIYTLANTYTITLIGVNANGCIDSVQYPIIISEPPQPAFS